MSPRRPSDPAPRPPAGAPEPVAARPLQESYLDDGSHLHGLIADEDEVVGLDDTTAGLDDPASLLSDLGSEAGSLQRWHDVGPAEDAVDPSAMLFPDADESGYTREGDALGLDEDMGVDELFAGLPVGPAPADGDAAAGVDLLGALPLPALPALPGLDADEGEGAAVGPDDDTDDLSEELLRRSGRDLGAGGGEA